MLNGKVAIVTGGDSGIGHAIALELAARGAAVTVNFHRNEAAASATVKAITDAGGRARTQQGDVSKIADIAALVDGTVAAYGRLDVMVNNAGMETRTSVLETTAEQFDLVVGIDLRSAFFGVQLAARQMIKQGGGGHIINIAPAEPTGVDDTGIDLRVAVGAPSRSREISRSVGILPRQERLSAPVLAAQPRGRRTFLATATAS